MNGFLYQAQTYIMSFQNFFHHTFGKPYCWKALLPWMPVISVQISGCQRTPIISHNHAIRIEHGNYFKYKPIAKFLKKIWIKLYWKLQCTHTHIYTHITFFEVVSLLEYDMDDSLTFATGSPLVIKSSRPFIIQLAWDSPGWTRAVTTTTFFLICSSREVSNKEQNLHSFL